MLSTLVRHHAFVSQVLWADVKDQFDLDDGSLKDLYVFGTNAMDWQTLIDLIRSRGWRYDYTEDNVSVRLPSSVAAIFLNRQHRATRLAFWPADSLRVHAHFFDVERIELDLDPHDIQGQPALDQVCQLLRALGRALTRDAVLTWENSPQATIIAYSHLLDQVQTTH
ncbi:MAG: hypothetical protein QOJ29_4945 [Thermoleophilaceae bacterium]|nr:hypothetical protein [Thermoleophilaceae bacterium]